MTRFGHFELKELIGRGGFGEVHKALNLWTKEVVALKRLRRDQTDDDLKKRFAREQEVLEQLEHPNIIHSISSGVIDDQFYIEMPMVTGENLAEILARSGPLVPERAVRIVEQVASALDAAHAKKVVHRDVTPSNILVSEQDTAHLIDFGISRSLHTADQGLTLTGHVVGTIAYMAPERFDGARDSPATDVYSLACVLFEMVTGQKAYPRGNERLNGQHIPPRRPSSANPDVPETFNGVILKGLAVEPHSRHASAGALADAASAALASAWQPRPDPPPAPPRPPGPPPKPDPTLVTPRPRPPHRERRWRPAAVGVGLVVVAALVAGWALFPRGGPAPEPEITVGRSPSAIAMGPDPATAYVANDKSDSVSVVDLASRKVPATIPVGDAPKAVAVNKGGTRAYVVNSGSNSVSVIDLKARSVAATVPVGKEPIAVVVSADGSRAFVSNSSSGTISVIDTSKDVVISTLDVSFLWGNYLYGLAVTPDGSRVLVSMTSQFFDDVVKVLDTDSGDVVASIRVGEAPRGLVIGGNGRYAYVANSSSATISVIDVANDAVTTNIPVGRDPESVVLDTGGRHAYVTNSSDGTFSIIDTATNLVTATPGAGMDATTMSISPDGRRAYLVGPDSDTVSTVDLPR